MIERPISVEAMNDYSIYVCFADGTQGEVSLKHLAHKGVFQDWDKNNLFSSVHIDESGAIVWNENIDICSDNVYLHLKGMSFEQWKRQNQKGYATN